MKIKELIDLYWSQKKSIHVNDTIYDPEVHDELRILGIKVIDNSLDITAI